MKLFNRLPVPISSPITNLFGAGNPPHRGLDYGIIIGTPIINPSIGESIVVPFTNSQQLWNGARVPAYGIGVCLDHVGTPWYSLYAHLSRADVAIGDSVAPGQLLGLSGSTGVSTGPHLHWQLCQNSQFPTDIAYSANPLDYVEEEMTLEEVEALVRKVYDEMSASYYRRLTTAYWDRNDAGAFSEEPDQNVVEAIAKKINEINGI